MMEFMKTFSIFNHTLLILNTYIKCHAALNTNFDLLRKSVLNCIAKLFARIIFRAVLKFAHLALREF